MAGDIETRCELTPLNSLSAADLSAWERLGERAAEPNPFYEASFVTAAAAALGAADVHLLSLRSGEEWIGCVPVQATRLLGRPVAVATWKHSYSFLSTPLVDRDRVEQFATALARGVREREHGRFLALRRASDGPVLAAIRRAMAAVGKVEPIFEQSFERAALERRDAADYLSGMKSRRRSELKRQRRKLAEALGGELESRDRSPSAAAVEQFLTLEASGWKGRDGTAMASSEGSADLFRAMCADFGARGRLRLRALEAGGRVAAMTCDVVAGDTVFGFKSAFDEELRRYSPGIQLQLDNVTAFHEHREERLIDSCAEPDNETMNSLWPDRRRIVTVVFARRSAANRVLGRALAARGGEGTLAAAAAD